MAERKTKYTNADLRRGGPATVYGPWETVGRKNPAMRSLLDEMIEAGETPESVVAGARAELRRAQPLQAALNDASRRHNDIEAAKAQERAASPVRAFVQGVRESPVSQGAMLAGSVMPSPLQPVFAGSLAIDALVNAAEDPSAMSAINAGLMMTPAGRMARNAIRSQRVAAEGKQVAEGLYRQTGMSRGREVPYRAGSGVSMPTGSSGAPRPTRPTRPSVEALEEVADQQFWAARPAVPRALREAPGLQVVDDVPATQSAIATPDEAVEVINAIRSGAARLPARAGTAQSGSLLGDDPIEIARLWRKAADIPAYRRSGTPTRVPMGATGDEYAAIRERGGAFNKANRRLDPEEAAAEDEFWGEIARRYFGR